MNEMICAVVVTYNRKKLLIECLESLREQSIALNAIYVIDNASTDGTPELLYKHNYINELPNLSNQNLEICSLIKNFTDRNDLKLYYVRLCENTGGAGGFYEGIKRAYEKGYDWLWLMDDDAEPRRDALEKLSHYFDEKNISALVNVVKEAEGVNLEARGYFNLRKIFPHIQEPLKKEMYIKKKVLEIDFASFVGVLINRNSVKKIGFPKKEFFIFQDDLEYCIRLRKLGKILLITDSIILHKNVRHKNKNIKVIFGKKIFRHSYDSFWPIYFTIRNLTWIGKKYHTSTIDFYINLIIAYTKNVCGIILFDDLKLRRIKLITRAYIDGLKGNFDNKQPEKILYD